MGLTVRYQTPKNVKEKQRFEVIDTLRGMSLFYMMFLHLTQFALLASSIWFWGFSYFFIDTIGVPAFLFTSGFSIAISVNKKFEKGLKNTLPYKIVEKKARNDALFRGLFIFVIGVIYNLGFASSEGGPMYIWSWTILQLMGISQILTYYFRKLSISSRFIFLLIILFVSQPLNTALYGNSNPVLGTLGYILFNPGNMNPPFPFLVYSFLGSIIGDVMMQEKSPKDKHKGLDFRKLMVFYGVVFFALGIIFGFGPINPYPTLLDGHYTALMNALHVSSFPTFLLRGSIPNVFYNSGALILIVAVLNRYYMSREGKWNVFTMFSILGKGSLSLYLGHHLAYFLVRRVWTVYTIWIPEALLLTLIISIFLLWYKFNKFKYGIEWGIEKLRTLFFIKYFTYKEELKKYEELKQFEQKTKVHGE